MLFYSPKAHIKELWEEIFEMTRVITKFKDSGDSVLTFCTGYENKIEKNKKLINALLEHYFDLEEDEEFIHDNKPE